MTRAGEPSPLRWLDGKAITALVALLTVWGGAAWYMASQAGTIAQNYLVVAERLASIDKLLTERFSTANAQLATRQDRIEKEVGGRLDGLEHHIEGNSETLATLASRVERIEQQREFTSNTHVPR